MDDHEEEVVDRISNLPDPVLLHILSFLPTKDAVETVFVPGFRYLWRFLSELTFDHGDFDNRDENFLHFVRHVLFNHENSITIHKFVLKMDLTPAYVNRWKKVTSEVASWVHFVMRKNVKVLDLDFVEPFHSRSFPSYKLPSVIFRGNSLTELRLVSCQINGIGQIQLNCLKRLLLKRVFLNDEKINQILSGCSVLEELSLIHCYFLHRLAFRNPSIKKLILYHDVYDKDLYDTDLLEISCPNIESLDIAGYLEDMVLLDVSSVVVSSATFFPDFECYCLRYVNIEALLKKLGRCKMFTPCGSCILVFTSWQLRNRARIPYSWNCVEFQLDLSKWHHPGIYCLLRNSPYLETLAMHIDPGNEKFKLHEESYWERYHDFDGASFWSSQEGTLDCLQNCLKSVKVYGHIREPYVIDMIEFLLRNARVLETLEISTHKTSHPKVEFTTEQKIKVFNLPRASKGAVISFSL